MKKWLSYILLALVCTFMVSCADESMVDGASGNGDKVTVQLRLSLPGGSSATYKSRAAGTNTGGDLDLNTDLQRYIAEDDIYVLVFDNESNKLAYLIPDLTVTGEQGAETRTLTGTMLRSEKEMRIVVLANLKQNFIILNWDSMIGWTEKAIYEKLIYAYPKDKWTIEERFLPMWGTTAGTLIPNRNNLAANCDLYRGVAKMGITVDEGCETFELKEIYVYYVNESGYCVAPHKTPNKETNIQYTEPDVPDCEQRGIDSPVAYKKVVDNSFLDQIYLSEVNNKKPGERKKPLKVVVGGVYSKEGLVDNDGESLSYYRIDMEDDATGKIAPFDIIRNHSYLFNITNVSSPGTPTPEEALDHIVAGLTVEVEDWVEEPMRGLPDQYTLTTSQSRLSFKDDGTLNTSLTVSNVITVTSDYTDGWELAEKIEDLKAEYPWLTITKGGTTTDSEGFMVGDLTISVDLNYGVTREASFYVQAGDLKKLLVIEQKQPETANCYVVGDGTDKQLNIVIKGNGEDGLFAEGVKLSNEVALSPAYVKIIWETVDGLISLKTKAGSTDTQINKADFNENGTVTYSVNTDKAYLYRSKGGEAISDENIGTLRGGNALIGAFDASNHVIWSWHIWYCPENNFADGYGTINKSMDQVWKNGYSVMDRNLGALTNKPGVGSMGLLYQWGRKDPFIGAAYTNENNIKSSTGCLYTKNYSNGDNFNAAWGIKGVGGAQEDEAGSNSIDYAIMNPVKLLKTGLSVSGTSIEGKIVDGYLWGTDKGFVEGETNVGAKTIYDPCPKGYRVPPVDAYVFIADKTNGNYQYGGKTGWKVSADDNINYKNVYIQYSEKRETSSYFKGTYRANVNPSTDSSRKKYYRVKYVSGSEHYNWNKNLIYIPHKTNEGSNGGSFSGKYEPDGKYYGFWINYKENKMPTPASGNWANNNNTEYNLKNYGNLGWFPISGAYDPNENKFSFKDIKITQGSSINVNSFLWTNSTVLTSQGVTPAAMFLHGAESNHTDWWGGYENNGSGRHIHALKGMASKEGYNWNNQYYDWRIDPDNIIAMPQQAGAVRCIREIPKDFNESNRVLQSIELDAQKGKVQSVDAINGVICISGSWKVVDPGAPWFSMTPNQADADRGKGTALTFTTLEDNTGSSRTAIVKIQFSEEKIAREIKVTQKAK